MWRDDLDVVELAVVLHSCRVDERDLVTLDSRLREFARDALLESLPGPGDHDPYPRLLHRVGGRQDRHVDRLVVAVLEVGAGTAVGGEPGRPRGDEDVAVGDSLGVAGNVQRPAAAVAE